MRGDSSVMSQIMQLLACTLKRSVKNCRNAHQESYERYETAYEDMTAICARDMHAWRAGVARNSKRYERLDIPHTHPDDPGDEKDWKESIRKYVDESCPYWKMKKHDWLMTGRRFGKKQYRTSER